MSEYFEPVDTAFYGSCDDINENEYWDTHTGFSVIVRGSLLVPLNDKIVTGTNSWCSNIHRGFSAIIRGSLLVPLSEKIYEWDQHTILEYS